MILCPTPLPDILVPAAYKGCTDHEPDPGHRLRLENYAYFEEGMQNLARRARVLGFFRQDAAEKKESALLVYIQQQLEYAKIWKLLEFSQVDHCLSNLCAHLHLLSKCQQAAAP